mgnify:CR=1 FL=1
MRRKLFATVLMALLCALALVWAGCAAAEPAPVPKGFALEDGRVTREGTALESEVYNVPDGLDNGIACWSVVGSESSEALREEETGVLFFGADGKCVAFIPLDSELEYKDLVWSPDGGRFVLVTGGSRPDVFFTLFTVGGEGMEKGAEFDALLGCFAWLDPYRFVLTRIDDARDTESGVFSVLALKLSVVLYDAAAEEEMVLKEADETRSYIFQSVSEDESTINLLELSVKSPKDWDDEEKVQESGLTVEVPAAG